MHLLCVELGENVKFVGLPSLRFEKNSLVCIGNQCRFRSRRNSNRIGLNHACFLTTTPEHPNERCKLIIGNRCGFSGTSIWCFKEIKIGNDVRIGANTLIMDGEAHPEDNRTSPAEKIWIEDNVFIGANCVIKKGVHIGKNSIIGMNSVVTKDIPANTIAAGCPAKIIRTL